MPREALACPNRPSGGFINIQRVILQTLTLTTQLTYADVGAIIALKRAISAPEPSKQIEKC